MTRFFAALTLVLGLAACETTTSATPVSPELGQQVQEFASRLDTLKGQEIGTDLLWDGAVARGNTVVLFVQVRQELADRTRDAPRGQLASVVERQQRNNFCRIPDQKAFIEAGGKFQMVFRDRLERHLFTIDFDYC